MALSDWSPYNRRVQSGMVDGLFAQASFTMIAAGPPRLSALGGTSLAATALASGGEDELALPIGLVQHMNLSHNRQFMRFWEIGSERSFFISGRTVGNISFGRVLYHGPSLLRMLYAYYRDPGVPPTVVEVFSNLGLENKVNRHDVKIPPGFENIFLNLASDLFTQPVGLLLYMRDSNEQTLGAMYLEGCFVPSHTMATDAQGTIIQESASIDFERAVPVATAAVELVTGSVAGALGLE